MPKMQCPYCSEMIQSAAVRCRFCKEDLRDAQPPAKKSSNTVLIIVVVIAGLVLIPSVLAALLLPAIARATRNAKVTSCVNNQSQLWKMMHNYMVQFGGERKSMPSETCGHFWIKMTETTPPLIDVTLKDIYACPVKGEELPYGQTDYRGPNGNVNTFRENDPVGADRIGNHGSNEGGCVLRKSGDVTVVGPADVLWTQAAVRTCP